MAYATTDDIMSNEWEFGGIIMEPSATARWHTQTTWQYLISKGQTYFVYHDGSLPHGSGYRRVACCEPFTINEDGTIDPIKKRPQQDLPEQHHRLQIPMAITFLINHS